MNLFDDVTEKDLTAVDFMSRLNRTLIETYLKERDGDRKLSKKDIAALLGVDRSVVTRMLQGKANLTERKIGELLWSMGYKGTLHVERVVEGNQAPQKPTMKQIDTNRQSNTKPSQRFSVFSRNESKDAAQCQYQ